MERTTSFAVATTNSATSAGLASTVGDSLFVFISEWSKNTVSSVKDSNGDSFSRLAFASETTTGSLSLTMWASFNVAAGATVKVTVTLAGPATYCAAVDVVDVTGVGPAPVDQLGTATNSAMAGQINKHADNPIGANSSDLVLAVVGSHNLASWSATGEDSSIDMENSLAPGVRMTAADFQDVATKTGTVWMNATANISFSQWIEDAVTLKPALPAPAFDVEFSESHLPTGTSWSVALAGVTRISSTSSLSFAEANGTYPFTVGPMGGYTSSPDRGNVTVSGLDVTVAVTFTANVTIGGTDDWPTYLGEVTRNSAQSGETNLSSAVASGLGLLWSFSIGVANPGYLQAEPVEVGNTVYVGGGNGVFYAINATTGEQVWQSLNLGTDTRCKYPDGITSSATVTGGKIYVGGGNGYLDVLDQATGKIDWQYLVGSITKGYYIWSSPLVLPSLGYVYIGVSSDCDNPLVNGGLEQISLSTHLLVHFFSDLNASEQAGCVANSKQDCGGSIWGSPSYDASTNTIWAATGNGYAKEATEYSDSLMEWDATSLTLLGHWTIPAAQQTSDGDFGTTPTLVDPPGGTPMVFVTDKNGWSYAFDRATLDSGPVWQYKISSSPNTVTPDAYGGGLIYIGGHSTNIGGKFYNGSLRAFKPTGTQPIWAVGMPGTVYGAPVYANGLVVVVGGDQLNVLNSTTGKSLFT